MSQDDPRECRRRDGMGKVSFFTKRSAKRHLKALKAHGIEGVSNMVAYRCEACGSYHVGHNYNRSTA